MDDIVKFERIIPTGPKKFAYQQENIAINSMFSIKGFMPFRSGSQPYENTEKDKISEYELVVEKFTGNSFTVTLYKTRKDTVDQRKQEGRAIIREGYQATFDFAEFVNAIFKDRDVMPFVDEEHFPQKIREEMKKVYLSEPPTAHLGRNTSIAHDQYEKSLPEPPYNEK